MVEPRAPGEADHFPVGKAGGPKARRQAQAETPETPKADLPTPP